MNLKSSNPAFSNPAFASAGYGSGYAGAASGTMTVQGTIGKTSLLLGILFTAAIWSWSEASRGNVAPGLLIGALVGSLVVGLWTFFSPKAAPWTAPLYAAFEGVLLGTISYFVDRQTYPGLAIQAVGLTCGTLCVMLGLYASRIIRVTAKLRAGIYIAFVSYMLFMLTMWILSLCGVKLPLVGGPFWILFCLAIVGLAAFMLLLDFDMIEQGAAYGAPKWMEWYGGYALMISLVWLYIQILRLLMVLYSDRR